MAVQHCFPALLLQSEHLRLGLGKGRVQDLNVGPLLLERLLLCRHFDVLPLLGPHHHLVLVHQLSDERVLPQDLASEDGVEAGDVLVLGVAGHELRHHSLVPFGHLW